MKIIFKSTVVFLAVALTIMGLSGETFACPSPQSLQKAIQKAFFTKITVTAVMPSPVKGLCEVIVRTDNLIRIIYTDPQGKFLITGKIFKISTGEDITQAEIGRLNRFSKNDFNTLKKYVVFSVGNKGPVIYFISDPVCPYCKRAAKIVKKMALDGLIQAKFVLYPLPFHPGAKQQSISIICDHKGLKAYETGYLSGNQCKSGRLEIKATKKFLNSKGIFGTPTYIFPNGTHYTGILNRNQIISIGELNIKK